MPDPIGSRIRFDVKDAFVEKAGSRFAVKQGNTGKVLSTWGTSKEAQEEVDRLHRKNKPSTANRGAQAKAEQGKAAQKRKEDGADRIGPRITFSP